MIHSHIVKAQEKGLVTGEQARRLSNDEIYDCCSVRFSTSEKVSDVSGRGVGLDVVQNKNRIARRYVEIASTRERNSFQYPLTSLSYYSSTDDQIGSEMYGYRWNSRDSGSGGTKYQEGAFGS